MTYGARMLALGALGAAVALSGCGGLWDAPRGTLETPPGRGMERLEVTPQMQPEEALLSQRASAIEIATAETREHVRETRDLPPEQWPSRMMEHTAHVAWVLETVRNHTVDMYQRMRMSEEEVSALMGMRPEEHREMMDEIRGVREEAARLQVALPAVLEAELEPHLDRLERVMETIEGGVEQLAAAGFD